MRLTAFKLIFYFVAQRHAQSARAFLFPTSQGECYGHRTAA